MRPFEADRRIYVVFGAHTMNEDAADALLKDLEEPPDYAVIVLVADDLGPLAPTIRSRCQHVPFKRLSQRAVKAYLSSRGVTGEGLEAGKTKLKYKDVDVGVVKAIKLSEDPTGVIVTAEMVKEAERHLVEDTRFWVVRARVGVLTRVRHAERIGGRNDCVSAVSGVHRIRGCGATRKREAEQRKSKHRKTSTHKTSWVNGSSIARR